MPAPKYVSLGPLTRTISNGAFWLEEDLFPAWQEWSDEIERVLQHLEAQGQFERFLPRLRNVNAKHRDAKLAEGWVSFFLFRNGFSILQYDPPGADGNEGDLVVRWRDTSPIFLEVKAPGWHGELLSGTKGERPTSQQLQHFKNRIREPKDKQAEAHWIDPVGQALRVIEENALRKLFNDRPNLVVVVDDFFVSPIDIPNLEAVVNEKMEASSYERLGGILFLKPDNRGSGISYRMDFIENTAVLPCCRLPQAVSMGFSTTARDNRRKRSKQR